MTIRYPLEAAHFIEQVQDIPGILQGDAPLDEVVPIIDEEVNRRSAAEEREHVGVPAFGEVIGEQKGGVRLGAEGKAVMGCGRREAEFGNESGAAMDIVWREG